MIKNRPRLFSVLRKEIPKRKPFTEGVYHTEGPKRYYINKNRRQSIIEQSKIKNINLNRHLNKIKMMVNSNYYNLSRFMNLYLKARNRKYTNSEYKKEVDRLFKELFPYY